ncbi:hypothetical protein RIF29_33738 [Crotalaria pallida]|uniref:Uncharacterized protein n=1 Tax=Crotalaria pallida TaxID=3830 RepID=A0AAN9HWZ7_CROPI
MATNRDQEKWYHVKEEQEEEEDEDEEEEALSLCDLPNPITLLNIKDQDQDSSHVNYETTQEEFDFSSWNGLFPKEQEMCAADDVFFQGQMLPLHHSFKSNSGSLTKGNNHHNHSQSIIRSESLGRVSMSESRSNSSSRSSSVRSQNSSSSTISTTTTTRRISISKHRIQNQFHTHPSPKPQLKISGPMTRTSGRKSSSSSSAWEIFRIGVVPTPELGLQDLKIRSITTTMTATTTKPFLCGGDKNDVSIRDNSGISNSTSTKKSVKMMSNKTHHHHKDKSKSNNHHHVFKQFMSGCKCSVETVPSDIGMIKKGGTKRANKTESTTQHAPKEKVVVELKKQKHRQKLKQGKKAIMSRRRTFEWLKELHACHPDEEALLSN